MIYVWAPLLFILTDAQFISSPASTFSKCSESELDLPWTYSVATNNAASVKWKKDGLTMLTWTVPINNYGHENGYNSSKIVHKSNGNVVIKTLSPTDAGVYTCEVTYAVTGNSIQSTGVTLEISSCDGGDGGGLSGGIIAAIVIGVILFICLVAVAVIAVFKLRRRIDYKEESYLRIGKPGKIGKPRSEMNVATNYCTTAKWTKDGTEVPSHGNEPTVFEINYVSEEAGGIYVCTFNKTKLKYHVFVIITEETVYAKEGESIEFGEQNIVILASNAKWTKEGVKVISASEMPTMFKIERPSLQDEHLYVCTFNRYSQLWYHLIVVETEETVYVNKGNTIEFGKTISDTDATENANWTKDTETVALTNSNEPTKFKIIKASKKDKGTYVCTFGTPFMYFKYHVKVKDHKGSSEGKYRPEIIHHYSQSS